MNDGPFHIGISPTRRGIDMYFDELKIFDRLLSVSAIIKNAGGSNLLPFSSHGVLLGCTDCQYPRAERSCDPDYHVCTLAEVLGGGYLTAEMNGWLK